MIELTPSQTKSTPRKLEAVVLDWAGTTVDFGSRAPIAAIRAAFEAAGVPVTEAEARRPMGRAKRDHLQSMLAEDELRARWRSAHRAEPSESDLDRLYEQFLTLQADCVVAHSGVIDGCLGAIAACRDRGLKIGSSTGYTRPLLQAVARRAEAEGYLPDLTLCADDVSPGRPAPWLCLQNARELGATCVAAVAKVDDTPAGVEAGRNAGVWSVGVTASGNEVGLSQEAYASLDDAERERVLASASQALASAGAHYLIESIAELPFVIDRINERLAAGEGP